MPGRTAHGSEPDVQRACGGTEGEGNQVVVVVEKSAQEKKSGGASHMQGEVLG